MNGKNTIGRVIATENAPTTMDNFSFWTNSDLCLHAFDIVKVHHINGSHTYGVITQISHLTDAQSSLTGFISNDFGDASLEPPTERIGMNYVEAVVTYNDHEIYTPVHNDAPVYLVTESEAVAALGLKEVPNPLVCGLVKMYEGTDDEIPIKVSLNAKFLLGPEGAHLNISGISGLASKTSYAMFLMKAAQEHFMKEKREKVAYVIFNVKGKDLMAIHQPNDFDGEKDPAKERARVAGEYASLGLSGKPFERVKYFIPYSSEHKATCSTYLGKEIVNYMP